MREKPGAGHGSRWRARCGKSSSFGRVRRHRL